MWRRLVAVGLGTLAWLAWAGDGSDAARMARIDAMYDGYATGFPEVPSIDASALQTRLQGDRPPVLVDVRPAVERQVSIVPGALTAADVEASPERFADRQLVAYCTIGARSGAWAQQMRARGLDVVNLRGSLLAWTHAGGPLVDGDGQPTRRVHVYGARWDLTRLDHTPVVGDDPGSLRALR